MKKEDIQEFDRMGSNAKSFANMFLIIGVISFLISFKMATELVAYASMIVGIGLVCFSLGVRIKLYRQDKRMEKFR